MSQIVNNHVGHALFGSSMVMVVSWLFIRPEGVWNYLVASYCLITMYGSYIVSVKYD